MLLQSINQSGHELMGLEKDPRRKDSPVINGLDKVNKDWQALCVQLMNASYKLTEVQEQMRKYHSAKKVVITWLEQIETRLRSLPPFGIDPNSIKNQMAEQQVGINSISCGRVLCNSTYITPLKLTLRFDGQLKRV